MGVLWSILRKVHLSAVSLNECQCVHWSSAQSVYRSFVRWPTAIPHVPLVPVQLHSYLLGGIIGGKVMSRKTDVERITDLYEEGGFAALQPLKDEVSQKRAVRLVPS